MKIPLRGTSYANVVASLALVVALGGTGYAAATIGTNDIKNKNVTDKDLQRNSVNSAKIKDNGVRDVDVADIQMQDLTLLNGWET